MSTEAKLGCEVLELELGEAELDEPPAEALPVEDDGVEDELPLVAEGDEVELPDFEVESAATASVENAKIAAAVVRVTCFSMRTPLESWGKPPESRKPRAALF